MVQRGMGLLNAVQDGRCPAREVLLAARFRSLSPMRHERTKLSAGQSLRQTQAGSLSWHVRYLQEGTMRPV